MFIEFKQIHDKTHTHIFL